MGLYSWFESRNKWPKYYFNCTCDPESSQNSFFDLWSISHIFWGCVYSVPLFFLQNDFICLLITFFLAVAFELYENSCGKRVSAYVCCSREYEGDNFWNSVCDVISCLLGYFVVYVVHWNWLF